MLLRQQQRRRRRSCSWRNSTLSKRKMADRGNYDRAVRPIPLFNGFMTGLSKKGNEGDSYAVWRARLVINLCAKGLLSIVNGNDDDDDSDDHELQPSVQHRQMRAAHIMTSALGTGPFLFVQGVNNDPRPFSTSSTQSAKEPTRRLSCRPSTSSPPRSTVLFSTWCLSPSSMDWPCVWKRLVTESRNRCALLTSSTSCLRSRPYLQSCRRFVS
jgi:hypothetical protein